MSIDMYLHLYIKMIWTCGGRNSSLASFQITVSFDILLQLIERHIYIYTYMYINVLHIWQCAFALLGSMFDCLSMYIYIYIERKKSGRNWSAQMQFS